MASLSPQFVPHGSPTSESTNSVAKSDVLWTRNYVQVLAVQALFGLSFSAFLMLPKFLHLELHASATKIGWVTAGALIVGALAAPFAGPISARVSPRMLLLGGVLGSALAAILYLFVSHMGPLIYALRLVQGLTYFVVFNTTATFVADRVPAARLSQAIGYLGLSMLATNALAPAVTEPLAEKIGWGPAFALAGFAALLAVPLVLTLKEPAPRLAPRAVSTDLDVAAPRLLAAYFVSGLIGLGFGTLCTFSQPHALALGAKRVGDFFFGYVGAAVVMRLSLVKLTDRVGPGRVALGALVLYGVVALCATQLTPSRLLPLGIGLGVAHGLIYPSLTAFTLGDVSSDKRSAVMGWFTGAYHVGYSFAVLGFGPVADSAGFPFVFSVAGICVLTGVWPLFRAVRPRELTVAAADGARP
jgi:MFS family permease